MTMAPAPAFLAEVHAGLGGRAAEVGTGAFALPDAGYFGLRTPDEYLLVDCGPLGPAYLPGHGHCDLLAFEWSTGGRRIVVDQGTHQYVAGPRRWASRRTANHNTLAIDGAEQSDIYGAFRCGRRARPELRDFTPDGQGFRFEGSHDGYLGLQGAPRHVRRIEAQPGTLRISDRLEGGAGQNATVQLLLHPDCRVEAQGPDWLIRNGPVTVRVTSSAPAVVQDAEWYPDIHVALPTARLSIAVPASPRQVDLQLVSLGGSSP
jgi:uncharacterized heparinase superfamily protein